MSSSAKNLVLLLGPTAVGKSSTAVRLAVDLDGEIINCDSMQVYRGFDIGTDKPSPEDLKRVPHHLLDICEPDQQFTAAAFIEKALDAAVHVLRRSRLPLITGGTGLYMTALTRGLFPEPVKDGGARRALEQESETRGLDALYEELREADEDYARKIGRRDRVRIIRGLEVFRTTGIPISQHFRATRAPAHDFNIIMIGLRLERRRLYELIESRVERMFARGIVEEVKHLISSGVDKNSPPFRALGYKHVLAFLRGEKSLEDAVEQTKTDTRHYAKRQITWFNKMPEVRWFSPEDYEALKNHIKASLI